MTWQMKPKKKKYYVHTLFFANTTKQESCQFCLSGAPSNV